MAALPTPNPPQDLPEYVRFSPKTHEVILLLKRFIRKEHMPTCAVKFQADADFQDTVSINGWTATKYPYFEEDEYWFFLHRKQAKDKNVDRRLGDLGTWKARGRSTNIYIGAQHVGIKQKYELMKGKVKTGWSQFEYTRFSNKFEKICVTHLIFAKKPEVDYPSDISEEEAADEEDGTDEEEQQVVNLEEAEEEDAAVDEEEQTFVTEQQVVQVQAHEGQHVNEQQGLQEQVVYLEEAEEDAAAADEEEQTFVNEQQVVQLLAHEGELANEPHGLQEPVVNSAADADWDWTLFLNTDEDGLTFDELFGDGDSERR